MNKEVKKYTDKRMNIIVNKIGLTEEEALFCIEKHKKYAIWLANQIKDDKSIIKKNEEIDLILDWKRVEQTSNLNDFNFEQALEKANEFQKNLFINTENSLSNKNVVLNCGKFKWVQLLTDADCKEEGQAMGHCIGSNGHNQNISLGKTIAFSLRDEFNRPHLTFEAKEGSIFEFKGTGNSVPKVEYLNCFYDLFKKFNFKTVTDYTFFKAIENNLQLAYDINELNSSFFNFDFKLKLGLNPFNDGDIIISKLNIFNTKKIDLPNNIKVYSNLELTFTEEVKLGDNLMVGGNLSINCKKIILGKKLKVGGNVLIKTVEDFKMPKDAKVFGNIEIKVEEFKEVEEVEEVE
jgi:hypothetical protein